VFEGFTVGKGKYESYSDYLILFTSGVASSTSLLKANLYSYCDLISKDDICFKGTAEGKMLAHNTVSVLDGFFIIEYQQLCKEVYFGRKMLIDNYGTICRRDRTKTFR